MKKIDPFTHYMWNESKIERVDFAIMVKLSQSS